MVERLLSEIGEMLLAIAVMIPVIGALAFFSANNNIETNTLMNAIQYSQGGIGSGEDSQVLITLESRGHILERNNEKLTLLTEDYELEESFVGRDIDIRQNGEVIIIEVS